MPLITAWSPTLIRESTIHYAKILFFICKFSALHFILVLWITDPSFHLQVLCIALHTCSVDYCSQHMGSCTCQLHESPLIIPLYFSLFCISNHAVPFPYPLPISLKMSPQLFLVSQTKSYSAYAPQSLLMKSKNKLGPSTKPGVSTHKWHEPTAMFCH